MHTPDFSRLERLPEPLLAWYDTHRRHLPWREDPAPYHVWLSEIMLQQTRVEAALPYYERFLREVPDIPSLAALPEERLLKLWEGLGYYSRARNLQKAALLLVERYGGALPADYDAVRALPGVGDYTAGAICSIAFGLPTPAVDGNVVRVVSRLAGDEGDSTRPAVRRDYRERLAALYPAGRAGDFTQALMELGALLCLPNGRPRCGDCPAAAFCAGCASGHPETLPVKPPKKPRRQERRRIWLLLSPAGVLLRGRPARGLLAGLWEFPNELGDTMPAEWGIRAASDSFGGTAKHIFTHIEWRLTARVVRAAGEELPPGWVWADGEELRTRYAVPGAFDGLSRIVERELKEGE